MMEDGYITITGLLNRNNDKFEISSICIFTLKQCLIIQNSIAFLYGPVVLAGQLGKEMPDPVYGTPVLLTDNKNVNDWMKPAGRPLQFEMKGVGKPM